MESPERLNPVHRLIVAVLILMVGAMLPVAAQTEAQTGTSLEATVGLDGFVAAGRPSTVKATISSPVLVAGRLRVRGAGVSVSRTIEVPAGGEQVYELAVPPLEDGSRLTVEVLDRDDEPIASETVTTRSSFDELTVGIVGDDQIVDALTRVRTIITDRPVAPLLVPTGASAAAFDVVDYLVLTRGGADRLHEALSWASGGGGLVLDASVAASADLPATPMATGVEGVSTAPLGAGRVVVVTAMETRSGEDWAAILRPTALDLGNSPEWAMFEEGGGLLEAASQAGSRQVPSLPWLLFAILGFALLVGPVNFIVLSRLRKRDWAWVTIPVMAMVAVVGFWVAGRQRIAGTNLTHASVIVVDGTVEARSAVLVAAGVSGERVVSFDPEASIFPERSTFGATNAELRIEGDNAARVELDQLGFTGIGLVSSASQLGLPTVAVADGQVAVENGTEINFWGWGVMRGGAAVVAPSDLAPNSTGEVASPGGINQFGFGFIDALINQRQLWDDPQRSNSLWPLGQVLGTHTMDSGLYFVGLTDDYEPDVEVDGSAVDVPGPTILVMRISSADGSGTEGLTSAGASVVGTGFINWLDWSSQHVVSTDELTVSFTLPDPAKTVSFHDTQQFGIPAQEYLAWDWGRGEFAPIERDAPLPPTMVSVDGQVYVRLVGAENGDNPFSPDSLSLEWEA
ncbi:MAG: hypothetical protein ACRDVD_05585 [Acidimicrobiia bacterium]